MPRNGIDLLEVRQTRGRQQRIALPGDLQLPAPAAYLTDSSGQTTTYTYNPRGQMLTEPIPRGETTTYTYDANGYLLAVDGPAAGDQRCAPTPPTMPYGRDANMTDVSGYMVTFDYDALDRATRSHPSGRHVQPIHL